MSKTSLFFSFLRLFSVDVAFGAVAAAFYAHWILFETYLSGIHALTLFFSVTALYSFDHLADVARIGFARLSPRRKEHAENSFLLLSWMCFSFSITVCGAFFLPISVQVTGLFLGLFMLLYFIGVFRFQMSLLKDVGVTIGYSLGIWVPVVFQQPDMFRMEFVLLFILFVVNTLFIMVLYALADKKADEQEHIKGFFSTIQVQKEQAVLGWIGFAILLIEGVLCVLGLIPFPSLLPILLQLSGSLLFFRYGSVDPNRIRLWGEWSYGFYLIPIFF